MTAIKRLSIALAILAGVALVVSGFGFSSVTADRGVHVAVVNDSDAFVGYQTADVQDVEAGEQITLVNVTNRFEKPVSVTDVDVQTDDEDAVEVGVGNPPQDIQPGESAPIPATVNTCEWSESATVSATVSVNGENLRATIFGDGETVQRSFTISCESPVEGVRFDGNGNAKLHGPARSVWADVYFLNKDGGVQKEGPVNLKVGNEIKGQFNSTDLSASATIVGIQVSGSSTYYHHPQFNRTECSISTPRNGSQGVSTTQYPFSTCE